MPEPQTLLLSIVTRLLDDRIPARLLALGDAAAVLAMADGSLVGMFSPDYGPPEEIGAKLRALVEGNPSAHLKLVLVGGGPELRKQLPRGGGMFSRRAVQLFHLGPGEGDAWSVWIDGGARLDSPMGEILQAAGRGELPPPDRATLGKRVERPPPLTAEEHERLVEGRAFADGLRGRPRASLALLVGLVGVFLLEELWGGSETVPTLVRMGGNTADALGGEPWRLLSSALLHAGWFHMAVNGFVLFVLGGFLEKVLGVPRYGVLLGAAAVGGSLASAWLSSGVLSVGASGAIWGVLGAAAALSWRPQGLIPEAVVGTLRRNAMINLVINLGVSFHPQVDLWAHLGGGVVGAALVGAGVLTRGASRYGLGEEGRAETATGRGLVIAAVSVVALFVASLAAAWSVGRPWELTREPTAWSQHELGPVVLEAPALLGVPQPIPPASPSSGGAAIGTEPGGMAWSLGDPMRDPMVLTVEIEPHGLDAATLAERTRSFEADSGPAAPSGARVSSPWQRRQGDGPPTFAVEHVYDEGPRLTLLLQVRDDVDVWIKSERWPTLASTWAPALQRMHESLDGASPASSPDPRR